MRKDRRVLTTIDGSEQGNMFEVGQFGKVRREKSDINNIQRKKSGSDKVKLLAAKVIFPI